MNPETEMPPAVRVMSPSPEPDMSPPHSEGVDEIEASWVRHCSQVQPDSKMLLGRYVATHKIEYGNRLLIGSGTTLNYLMDETIERQVATGVPLDLSITTTNMHVIERGSDAKSKHVDLLLNTQLSLTGGRLQIGLRSLVGEFAVAGIRSNLFHPDLVVFGAIGVFIGDNGELEITYQFEEELPVQVSFGSRATDHRILLFDHSKLGRRGGWKADLGVETLLRHTRECSLITTVPAEGDAHFRVWKQQVAAFQKLLENLADSEKYPEKELRLILVRDQNEEAQILSLSACRTKSRKHARTNGKHHSSRK